MSRSLTSIPKDAFAGCTSLKSIDLPNSILEIHDYAFRSSGLRSLLLSENVMRLGEKILHNCDDLHAVTLLGQDVDFNENTFPAYDQPGQSSIITRNPYFSAPLGSETLRHLKEYGLQCSAYGGELVLNHPLSIDVNHPTRVLALDDTSIDLSNQQGYTITKIIDYYTYADMPRNDGRHKKYQIPHDITDNTWEYDEANGYFNTSTLILLYQDDRGNTYRSRPYFIAYGVADLNEPLLTSHVFASSKDGAPFVSRENLTITWVPSEDARYKVKLAGGALAENWFIDNLSDNRCTIPAEQLIPSSNTYDITVTAISRTTGEAVDAISGSFSVYAGDTVSERAVITAPTWGETLPYHAEYCETVPWEGDLTIEWLPVENAVSYIVKVDGHIDGSNSYYPIKRIETTDNAVVIEKQSLEWYVNKPNIHLFSVIITAVDRYGNRTNDLDSWHSPCYFYFGNPEGLNVRADDQPITCAPRQWTALNAGGHRLKWDAADNADRYEVALIEIDGNSYRRALEDTLDASECSLACELENHKQYILVIHAFNGEQFVNGGWYFMDVNRVNQPALKILESADPFMADMRNIHVSWTDTGAVEYTARLFRRAPGDSDSPTDFFGYDSPYYTIEVETQNGIKTTECTFNQSLLEYGGMYRILVQATCADGFVNEDDVLFKVGGHPDRAPEVLGARLSSDPSQLTDNAAVDKLLVQWKSDLNAVRYEVDLYSVNSSGRRLDMISTVSGTDAAPVLQCYDIPDDLYYELVLRQFDADNFSIEYRRYFDIKRTGEINVLILPAGLTTIGEEAFSDNTDIQSVIMNQNVQSIENRAFWNCTALSAVEIPASVKQIDNDAFAGCNRLTIGCEIGSAAFDYAIDHGMDLLLH